MVILLSPAKIQNFKKQDSINNFSEAEYLKEAKSIIGELKKLSVAEIEKLLKIKKELALKTADQYYNFGEHNPASAKQAVMVYSGEVFRGLDASSFSLNDFEYLQSHLRILSALYGILRPLDLIQAYRLDLNDKLKVDNKSLYEFWGEKVTKSLNSLLKKHGDNCPIINLASEEYFKVLDKKMIKNPIYDLEFLQNTKNGYKQIVIYTKKARGLMSKFIIKNNLKDPEDLKAFDEDDYWYNNALSSKNKLVFTRK